MKKLIGFTLGIFFFASTAQAVSIQCKNELRPFYRTFKKFDGSEKQTKKLITQYHARRTAIYSVCQKRIVRKFEKDYSKRVQNDNSSQTGTMGYYPKVRKTVDLGVIEERAPSSRSY